MHLTANSHRHLSKAAVTHSCSTDMLGMSYGFDDVTCDSRLLRILCMHIRHTNNGVVRDKICNRHICWYIYKTGGLDEFL